MCMCACHIMAIYFLFIIPMSCRVLCPKGASKGGVLDLGLLRKSKTPSKGGVLDLGLLRKSKTPLQGGVLDLGLLKSPDPGV